MDRTSPGQFGDLLRGLRLRVGLSQEALAERAGISTRGISDLERGINRAPQRETAVRLANALDLAGDERAAFVALAQRRAAGSGPVESSATRRPAAGIPVPLTALVGREEALRALTDLLRPDQPADSPARLVTLTGPGGVGKTRLAIAAATDLAAAYADGVLFISLAGLRDPELVLATLVQTMGLRATNTSTPADVLAAHLRDRHVLLVLDNFEHLLAAAPELAKLLEACPHLALLVTSRAALRLRGEREVAVAPLALPDLQDLPALDVLERCPAVALFMERVREHHPSFVLSSVSAATVAEVCARLEGLPLALELAAAQIRLFSPRALLSRLERRLDVLTGGARDLPARQQTMRATIAWSYDQLDAGEQVLFRRLAVFAGGCTLEAVQAMQSAIEGTEGQVVERLRSLVDKSLLWQAAAADGERRFGMLETIREFGLEQISAGTELAAVSRAHAQVCLALAREAGPWLQGPEQSAWLARLEREQDNLRAALHWCLQAEGDPAVGLRLARCLGVFWERRSYLTEGRQWLEQILARQAAVGDAERAAALNHLGNLAYAQGDNDRARQVYQESLALRRTVGDAGQIARSLANLGNVAVAEGDFPRARAWYEESLALCDQSGDRAGKANVLNNLGVLARGRGDERLALTMYEQGYRLLQELGDSWSAAVALTNMGNVASALGELEQAQGLYRDSLSLRRDLADRQGIVLTLLGLGHLAHRRGQDERAAQLLAAGSALGRQIGVALPPSGLAEHERILQDVEQALGEQQYAAAWEQGETMSIERAIDLALGAVAGSSW